MDVDPRDSERAREKALARTTSPPWVGAVMRDVPMTSEGRDDLLTLTANHMNVLVHKADQAKGLSL